MQIRKYRESDRDSVREICKQTAFDSYKKDPRKLETVPIMFCDYFIEQEPENVFVLANDDDEAVGYIICAADYEKFSRKMSNEYMQRVKNTRRTECMYLKVFLHFVKQMKDRPVHMHIDILPDYQRQGWGTKLIDTLVAHLKEQGIDHLSIISVNPNSAGFNLYKKYGFSEHKKHIGGSVSLILSIASVSEPA